MKKCGSFLLMPLMVFSIFGCGGGNGFEVAPVSGTVRCNGQLLKDGLIVFTPVAPPDADSYNTGRAASGVVQSDGSFILSTYGENDGAIVGVHSIQVFAPAPEDDDAPITDANRYACGKQAIEKTVAEGTNVFDLELSGALPKNPPVPGR
jgi:hypothetical protein